MHAHVPTFSSPTPIPSDSVRRAAFLRRLGFRRLGFRLLGWLLLGSLVLPAGSGAQTPAFQDLISLRNVGPPVISPDGRAVAYLVRTADWEENDYRTEIWLWREGAPEAVQLTRTVGGSSRSPGWSPDGRWLAFLADRGKGTQVYALPMAGGEAVAVTGVERGVAGYAWSADGSRLAIARTEPQSAASKAREVAYGRWAVEDQEYRMTHLWVVDFDPRAASPPEPRRVTGEPDPEAYTVGSFEWSPDGTEIAFDHRPDPLINSSVHTDISVVAVATGAVRPLVSQTGAQSGPRWSPDGRWILFSASHPDTTRHYFLNNELARVPAGGGDGGGSGEPEVLTSSFDERVSAVAWLPQGIVFLAWQGVERRPFLLDPSSGRIRALPAEPSAVWTMDFSRDGRMVALLGEGPTSVAEVYRADTRRWRAERITDMTAQVAEWPLGTSEVVTWISQDGAPIEGVLRKPPDYDPSRRYPLLVDIHGGPTAVSIPTLLSGYVYPHLQWLNRGALVLEPNYRGSAGYGEAFRQLNVRNLGVGDAWDVLSGVDALVERGIVHPDSVGAMGWSQGGYISAFLTTTSDRFRAISVGAGISDWVTYYVNTDIHPFTRQYLRATPWEDPEIYATTSPMTYITQATTPTLIQHGELDRRVPIPNAYKLYQGLQDMGVPVELVVFQGFGHGINKPKERLAATWQNWQWFARWIWGEEVELPLELEEEPETDDDPARVADEAPDGPG
jgi:dipeptidyl aminopeptidase/acylaminoacyl peptidase